MTLLSLSDVQAGYETGRVLFGIDLDVEEGECVSLLGRNGAGKTTTMRSIVGAKVPNVTSGAIEFRGEDLLAKRVHERAKSGIGYVPEDRRCFPNLSVEENIQVAINHSTDPLDLDDVLEQFPELKEMRKKHARNMSGGEQQMLSIARALATNPKLMLLDEPSEGLAPFIVRRIEEIIQRINEEEGITVLVVEQNLLMALTVADRHYVLAEGEIVGEKTGEELRGDEAFRQRYLGV